MSRPATACEKVSTISGLFLFTALLYFLARAADKSNLSLNSNISPYDALEARAKPMSFTVFLNILQPQSLSEVLEHVACGAINGSNECSLEIFASDTDLHEARVRPTFAMVAAMRTTLETEANWLTRVGNCVPLHLWGWTTFMFMFACACASFLIGVPLHRQKTSIWVQGWVFLLEWLLFVDYMFCIFSISTYMLAVDNVVGQIPTESFSCRGVTDNGLLPCLVVSPDMNTLLAQAAAWKSVYAVALATPQVDFHIGWLSWMFLAFLWESLALHNKTSKPVSVARVSVPVAVSVEAPAPVESSTTTTTTTEPSPSAPMASDDYQSLEGSPPDARA